MKETKIGFSVSGFVTQRIELSKPELFSIEKLNEGKIITTIQEGGDVLLLENGQFQIIGKVVDIDNNLEYLEYFDYSED